MDKLYVTLKPGMLYLLPTTTDTYQLDTVSYTGENEMVLFVNRPGDVPKRICRMVNPGMTTLSFQVSEKVSFSFKGKGSCYLTFTNLGDLSHGITTSYMCDKVKVNEVEDVKKIAQVIKKENIVYL
ncbi:hypothetical protein EIN_169370 [Entamoeba invadens IP1]|uniref:Nucleoplasmin-like domain-containing protein n=1 Tax=Entamoeba invadens IP1 TaxID=370355 RepID=A0A0A1TVM9_ENTIV|nr:hypothetical protein EIN_169370 [Entamoeba invadens IP1]ELP84502.1 hypothetical protein EIN_169370 [Entamoeba invadens IP1]|eukprot:XP_004183848.1 hypothetical protein EIN_169370 [Entamoeba invadens IP1]